MALGSIKNIFRRMTEWTRVPDLDFTGVYAFDRRPVAFSFDEDTASEEVPTAAAE